MRKIKVIFLDVDGVMQSTSSIIRTGGKGGFLHKEHVDALNHILEKTGAYIVLTSTYRIMADIKEIKRAFMYSGVKSDRVISKTPELMTQRGQEIKRWLDTRKEKGDVEIESYVVIDDGVDMSGIDWLKFIKTNPDYGLTFVEAERAIRILNGKPKLRGGYNVYGIREEIVQRNINPITFEYEN